MVGGGNRDLCRHDALHLSQELGRKRDDTEHNWDDCDDYRYDTPVQD